MSNHLHLLVRTPNANLDRIIQYFVREVSRKVSSVSGRFNRIFGGRYKWSLIKQDAHLCQAYKYIYRNPVAVGLAKRVEDYPFSSIHYVAHFAKTPFPIYDDLFNPEYDLPSSRLARFRWLNEPDSPMETEKIRRGLRRQVYEPPAHRMLPRKKV